MKWIIITTVAAGIISLAFIKIPKKSVIKSEKQTELKGEFSPVVVLELFTSEGCSSCPSADNLLPQLANLDTSIIPLSFHVDYWNRLGWKDPFSSAEFSDRQRDYSRQFNKESVYTPQLVVNGKYEMVGSNKYAAESAIKKVLKEKSSIKLFIDEVKLTGNKIKLFSHSEGDIKKQEFEVVLVQKTATMEIKAGENRGSRLTHTNIVRVLSSQELKESNETNLIVPKDLNENEWEIILIARNKADLKINGATFYSPLK